jgi:C1A family cysteine protease
MSIDIIENNLQLPLGRLPSVDFRDRQFLLSPPPSSAIERRNRHWITGQVLDQGYTSQCVAYSGAQYLITNPIKNKWTGTIEQLYEQCQDVDEWPGTDYDGTSVRALFKVFKAKGFVSTYQWAFDVNTVVRHILTTGPVVFGTNWYLGMFDADDEGFIYPTGPTVGGHAYMVKGVNLDKKCTDGTTGAFRIINSWGRSWAQDGKCWMSFPTAARLISEWGEAATSTELKFKPSEVV